jgi:hypothetical protein
VTLHLLIALLPHQSGDRTLAAVAVAVVGGGGEAGGEKKKAAIMAAGGEEPGGAEEGGVALGMGGEAAEGEGEGDEVRPLARKAAVMRGICRMLTTLFCFRVLLSKLLPGLSYLHQP